MSKKQHLHFYKQMYRIRSFEDRANQLYLDGKMPGLTHMSSGQEATAVGVCEALRDDDYITSTHRGHGHCLAKGAILEPMFGELLGKVTGYCRGKGGSMHIADQSHGNLGANAIVGGSAGIATGAALTSKYKEKDTVAVCFFGDGALGQGLLYEVMNMASLWKLPVMYLCENNMYGEYTHYSETLSGDFGGRAKAFGIEYHETDGQDVIEVYKLISTLVEKMRKGSGPCFVVCNTYRYHGHHVGDINREYYRKKEEEKYWKEERDPLIIMEKFLIKKYDDISSDDIAQIKVELEKEADEAMNNALESPYPDPTEVTQHVYTE